jgi:hypothetical protein
MGVGGGDLEATDGEGKDDEDGMGSRASAIGSENGDDMIVDPINDGSEGCKSDCTGSESEGEGERKNEGVADSGTGSESEGEDNVDVAGDGGASRGDGDGESVGAGADGGDPSSKLRPKPKPKPSKKDKKEPFYPCSPAPIYHTFPVRYNSSTYLLSLLPPSPLRVVVAHGEIFGPITAGLLNGSNPASFLYVDHLNSVRCLFGALCHPPHPHTWNSLPHRSLYKAVF